MSLYTLTILVVWLVVTAKFSISHVKTRRKIEAYKLLSVDYDVIANNKDELYIDIKYTINGIQYFQRVYDLPYKEKVIHQNYKRAVSKLKKNKLPRVYFSKDENAFIYSNPEDWVYIKDYLKS